MPVRPMTPVPLPALAPTLVDGGGNNVLSMSRDRATLYSGQGSTGSAQTILKRSIDDGATWTNIFTFPGAVVGFHELDNGEALVAVGHATGSIYKSTGFAANPATATWAKVLDSSGTSCYFRGEWTLTPWTSSGPVVVVNEYGLHSSATGTPAGATKVWLSTDYGSTWTVIYDLAVAFPGVATLHGHGSAYDAEWDRIWYTYGDATGTGSNGVIYSDDRGATWTAVPGTVNTTGLANQFTTIAILANCVLLLTDGNPAAIGRIPRRGYRKIGALTPVHQIRGGTGAVALGFQAWKCKNLPGAPLLMCFHHGSSAATPGYGSIVATYDGLTFVELFRDTANTGAADGPSTAVGPTLTGKVVGSIDDSRQANMSRLTATLPARVAPAELAPLVGGTASVANGGTIAHGLGVVPTRYMVTPTAAGRQVAVTAVDATNLTVSLTDSAGTAVAVAENVAWLAGR